MSDLSIFLDAAKSDDTYWVEDAKIEFAVEFEHQMNRCQINKSQLASRLKTSPAYITKILRGDANFTIESMVKLARAVECSLDIRIVHNAIDVKSQNKLSQTPILLKLQTPDEVALDIVRGTPATCYVSVMNPPQTIPITCEKQNFSLGVRRNSFTIPMTI